MGTSKIVEMGLREVQTECNKMAECLERINKIPGDRKFQDVLEDSETVQAQFHLKNITDWVGAIWEAQASI